ncbi:MAG: efflux RND transporter periplasmic adaptor subunit [Gemmatimonadota bacterium]|nr:efflux RND transporter periplasmic adaptor subunit [Gemmatimonadota bacterium]
MITGVDKDGHSVTRGPRGYARDAVLIFVRRHRLLLGIAIVVLLAIGIVVSRRSGVTAPATGATAAAGGMEGMAGMSTDGLVHLTASQVREFGITYGTVDQRTLTSDVRTVGTVMTDESRTASVTPKISGFVERLYVNTTGQPVRRGEPLAEVYSPELLAAEEELLLARGLDRSVGQSSVPGVPSSSGSLVAAARRRLRLWDVSDAQIDDVLRSGKSRRTVTLYSPVTGVITQKKVTVGEAVQAGAMLYAVADLSAVWVEVQVREADAAQVHVGSTANLEFGAFPGRPFKGRIAFVYPSVAEQSRSIRARLEVANPDGSLKPGMFATVSLSSPTRKALTAPRTAIIQTGERAIAFVDMGHGALKPVDVEVGATVGEYVEILSGLEAGQRVVTSAQFLLDSESNLAEVMKGMAGMGGGMAGMAGMRGDASTSPPAGAGTSSDMKGMDMKGMDMKGPGSPSTRK